MWPRSLVGKHGQDTCDTFAPARSAFSPELAVVAPDPCPHRRLANVFEGVVATGGGEHVDLVAWKLTERVVQLEEDLLGERMAASR